MVDANDTTSELIALLKSGADIIECPELNTRLLTGFPNSEPIVWINDDLQTVERSVELSETAHDSDEIELVDFRGSNGLTYYRYALKDGERDE